VQKLHDFLAHSSEESEETSSPPRLVMNQSTGKLEKRIAISSSLIYCLFLRS